ncbi:MAG: AAA family ATPase, partial [Alphaproteobacteria bacterium]
MAKVNALRAPTPHPEGQNIIAVASGKGGVGKTWLAISLAHAFAKSQKQVLLFDGDLGLANVDVQLGLMPKRDIANVIGGEISLQQAAFPFGAGGFDIIAGRSGSGTLASLNGPKLARLRDDLAILSAQYDRVIVDLGAGLANSVQAFS